MNDLEDRLAALATLAPPIAPDHAVAGDLARAHRALRTRRTRRAGVVSLGAVVALGAGAAVVVVTGEDPPPPAIAITAPPSSGPTTDPLPPARDLGLVAYRGPQTPGFDVSSVPDGFVLQGADNISLAVARPDDDTGIFDFRHKIVVSVQTIATHGPLDPALEQIEVHGSPGTIGTSDNGTITLFYELPGDRLAFVQAWRDVGLTEDGVRRFAEDLTIADDVETVS